MRAYIGIMENKMETTIAYKGYVRIMEKENGRYVMWCVFGAVNLQHPLLAFLRKPAQGFRVYKY